MVQKLKCFYENDQDDARMAFNPQDFQHVGGMAKYSTHLWPQGFDQDDARMTVLAARLEVRMKSG